MVDFTDTDIRQDAFYKLVDAPEDRSDRKPFLPIEHWNALLRGESRTFELRCRDGTWGLCSVLPTRNQNGQIDAVIGVITDIESQKRAEQEACAKIEALEKARLAEKRYYRFLEIIPSGIAVTDPSGQITYATQAWYEMSGHRPCGFGEIRWQDVIHEEDLNFVESHMRKLASENQPVAFQFRMKRPWINSAGENCGSKLPRGISLFDIVVYCFKFLQLVCCFRRICGVIASSFSRLQIDADNALLSRFLDAL